MISLTIQEMAQVLELESDSGLTIKGITTDSREVKPGMLFAALKGERVDGHNYIKQAVQQGAVAVLAEQATETDVPVLLVENVLVALGQLASEWRRRINPVVIGITGSNGKTTTKELLASILAINAEVLATGGNYNNELGVPLTLFRLNKHHRFAVLEMGASKAGDIRYLAGIAKPDAGLITNVGPAHLQGFGDEEGVARAKGELYSSLPSSGFAALNEDEPWAGLWRDLCQAGEIIGFSTAGDAEVSARLENGRWTATTPQGSFELDLHLPGVHNVKNALAATSIAIALDIPLDQISRGLAATRPVPGRLNRVQTPAGWTVLDDTYNANPASLYAALQVLTLESEESWLVLGDMKELGAHSHKLHAEMGEAARNLGVRRLFTLGDLSRSTCTAFGPNATHFEDRQGLIKALRQELHAGVACLVKGSRSMAMEKVVQAIAESGQMKETG